MNTSKISAVTLSIKTGLNPRSNFKLNTPDAEGWYITVRELDGTGVSFLPQTDRVNSEALRLINNRSNLEVGDVLFSGTGTIGKTAIVKEQPVNWNIKEGVYVLKPDQSRVFPYYLLYYLSYHGRISSFNKRASGSTVFSIPMQVLGNLDIPLPSIDKQESIVSILRLLDDKISINGKIINELENIVKLTYEYWFVQFDFPDENGNPYKSSGGKMEFSDQVDFNIPHGWSVDKVGEHTKLQKGVSYSSQDIESGNGLPMINLGSIDKDRQYRDEKIKFHSGDVPKSKLAYTGDLLIACTDLTSDGLIIGCPIFAPSIYKACTFSMDLARMDITSDKILKNYLYNSLRTSWYHAYIKKFASGTNVRHLDTSGVLNYNLVIPDIRIQQEFEALSQPMYEQISKLAEENKHLAELRDWLLPMLMNGQAIVADL